MRSMGQALRPFRPGVAMLTTSKFSGFLGYAPNLLAQGRLIGTYERI